MANGDNFPIGKAVIEVVPELNQYAWTRMIEMLGVRSITTVVREYADGGYCVKETTTVEHQRMGGAE